MSNKPCLGDSWTSSKLSVDCNLHFLQDIGRLVDVPMTSGSFDIWVKCRNQNFWSFDSGSLVTWVRRLTAKRFVKLAWTNPKFN